MTQTMHIVCLKDTGHVLSAIAATTEGAPPELAALVGDDLPVPAIRSTTNGAGGLGPSTSYVPLSVLELKSVPLDTAVIANPLSHAIDGDRVVELPPIPAPDQPDDQLDNTQLKIDGGLVDTTAFSVVSLADDPLGTRRVQSGTFTSTIAPPTVDDLALVLHILPDDTAAAIPNGTYDIFVALEGHRIIWGADTTP